MTELADAAVEAVERADLPRRLKDQVLETLESREDVTAEQAAEITSAVEARYRRTRVDPLEPVGTVSAQSIGEPGTQMSIDAQERILIRRGGQTEVRPIGPFVDGLLEQRNTREYGDHEVTQGPEDLETLSLGADEQVEWKPVEEVSRHAAPDSLLEITLKSGRSIQATSNHSFVTRTENEIVPISGEDLEEGDWLPVIGDFDVLEPASTVDLPELLPADESWFPSTVADGGTETLSAGDNQNRTKQKAPQQGNIEPQTVSPVGGTEGLPETFPLDSETGFFIGAWLAEGSLADHYVSVSITDETFQRRIRTFAERFDLSITEYEHTRGFADSHDIRVNGTVLADLLRSICRNGSEKCVPGIAYGATDEFVTSLLAGYFSGDGNIGSDSIRASSTSSALIEGIALLLARFGVYGTLGEQVDTATLRIPKKFVPVFAAEIGLVGDRGTQLESVASWIDADGPDGVDQIPNFGDTLQTVAKRAEFPAREFNSATKRQQIGRNRLASLINRIDRETDDAPQGLETLRRAVEGDAIWDRIASIERVEPTNEYVYDLSVAGLETFTTGSGIVTHNTMNTFHYAGVAEIDVTQGLPRLIELVDARKTPDTPMMSIYLDDEHATDRSKAHEVVWKLEATRILALGDVSTNVADMLVRIDLNPDTLEERHITAEEVAETIESHLDVEAAREDNVIEFGPDEPSYRQLLQLVEQLREIVFKGLEEVSRVVIRKEQRENTEDEFVLYTEGSDFGTALEIEGVDPTRSTTNNIHEVRETLGIEAARESIIEETMNTLEEQGLDDVNVRHLMLVSDIMTTKGTIESIGRHGISGNKESVLARAAFEVTVNHLLDAAVHGEVDDLNGVTENVIVGKPIKLGTGDVDLRMHSKAD